MSRPSRLFVSEYVCGGGWPEEPLPQSLAREGRAMLLAFLIDSAQIPNCEVATTWDEQRCGRFALSGVQAFPAQSPDDEARLFRQLSRECDASYVIAPEIGNELARRCRIVNESGGRLLASALPDIELCSDKLLLADRLTNARIATIATRPFDHAATLPFGFPVVVKPRYGAGSESVSLCEDAAMLHHAIGPSDAPIVTDKVVQPFLAGRPCSVAALVDSQRADCMVFPVAQQRLSRDGNFTYLGGRIDGAHPAPANVVKMVRDVCELLPGLRGYIGFDFILPDAAPHDPVLVEINPRLTTSYLGYRRITSSNLAQSILQTEHDRSGIEWEPRAIEFSTAGVIESETPVGKIDRAPVAAHING